MEKVINMAFYGDGKHTDGREQLEPAMTNDEYIRSGASNCIVCNSDNISASEFEFDSSTSVSRDVTCKDCGESWKEIFSLTAIER